MATVDHRSLELKVLGSYETSIKGEEMVALFPSWHLLLGGVSVKMLAG